MTSVAVVAHRGKVIAGGLDELRSLLHDRGFTDPLWFEVDKNRQVAKAARRAVEGGADLLFVWGGDATVRGCLDAVAGSGVAVAVLPAGRAELVAASLGLPDDLHAAVEVGLAGNRRRVDLGVVDGERFAALLSAGFDPASLTAEASVVRRLARAARNRTRRRRAASPARPVRIEVDGRPWFDGPAASVVVSPAPVGTGRDGGTGPAVVMFPEGRLDDGGLHVGVVTTGGWSHWLRTGVRWATGRRRSSPLTRTTRGRRVEVRFARPTVIELDGGSPRRVRRFKARIDPAAVTVCVPETPTPVGAERPPGLVQSRPSAAWVAVRTLATVVVPNTRTSTWTATSPSRTSTETADDPLGGPARLSDSTA